MWFSGFLFWILSLTVEVCLRWELRTSPFFVGGKTCKISSVSGTYFPHCITSSWLPDPFQCPQDTSCLLMSHSCSKLTEMGPLENVIQYPSDSRTTPIFKEPWRFSRTSSCSSGTSSETSRPSLEKSVTLWRIYWSSTASSERLLRHIQGLLEPTCLSTKLLRPSQDAPQTRVTSLKRQFTTRSDTYSFSSNP